MIPLKYLPNFTLDKLILFSCGLIIVSVCGYILDTRPLQHRLINTTNNNTQLKTKLKNTHQQTLDNANLKQQLHNKTVDITPNTTLAELLPLIETTAKASHAKLIAIQPETIATKTELHTHTLQLQATGDYQQLSTFMYTLTQLDVCLVPQQLHLQLQTDSITANNIRPLSKLAYSDTLVREDKSTDLILDLTLQLHSSVEAKKPQTSPQLISLSPTNRPLSKLAYSEEVKEDSERKPGAYRLVREELSTDSTHKLPEEVESQNRSVRPLSKLAYSEEVKEGLERKTGVYTLVHEDLSTDSTHKLPEEVEFRQRSNNYRDPFDTAPTTYTDHNSMTWPTAEMQFLGTLRDQNHSWNVSTDSKGQIHLIDQSPKNNNKKSPTARLIPKPTYSKNNLLSLDLHNIKTKDLLQLLRRFSDKNILASDSINDVITIKLQAVTWSDALDSILAIKSLGKHIDSAMIFIAPSEELAKYEKQKQLSQQPETKIFKINHTTASSITDLLTKQQGLLSTTGAIYADSHTNDIIIHDNIANITTIKKLIQAMDVPTKKLLITAKIVNIDDAYLNELGIKLGTKKIHHRHSNDGTTSPTITNNYYGHFDFNIAKFGNSNILDIELAALENKGHAKIISAPKLMTTNNKPAHIESGAEIPYQEKTTSGATNIAFKKAVLSLQVTPEVIGTKQINLHLQLNQDKVSRLTIQGVPAVDTRKINTEVIVNNGDTIVLGGIYEWMENDNTTQQPLLNKIPYLGSLFRSTENQTKRTELLIFVTTKILPN